MVRNISREVIFTQDYSAEQEIDDPNNLGQKIITPERYSEFFTISKIDIESEVNVEIQNLQVQINPLKTKNPNTNAVKIAFILSSEIDQKIFQTPLVYVDGESKTQRIDDDLTSTDLISSELEIYPTDFETYSRERYGYYDIRDKSKYRDYSAFHLLQYERVVYQCVIIGNTYAPSGKINLQNTNRARFLYLIPFTPNLQFSRLAATALVNFSLESKEE